MLKCKYEVESMVTNTQKRAMALEDNLEVRFLSKEKVEKFILAELEKENIACYFRTSSQSGVCTIYAIDDDLLGKASIKIRNYMHTATYPVKELMRHKEQVRQIFGEYSDFIEHSAIKGKSEKACIVIGLPYAIKEIVEKFSRLKELSEDDSNTHHGICEETQNEQWHEHDKDKRHGVSVGDVDRKRSKEQAKHVAERENATEPKKDLSEPIVPGYDLKTETNDAKFQQETMQKKPVVSGAVLGNSGTNLDKSPTVSNKPVDPGYALRVSDDEKDTWDASELKEGETDFQGDGMLSVKSVENEDSTSTLSHSRSGDGDFIGDSLPTRKESDSATGEELWSDDSSKKSGVDTFSISKGKTEINFTTFTFLANPSAKKWIDQYLKENFKSMSWRAGKEENVCYLYSYGTSAENCKEAIHCIQKSVKEECISKAIYMIAKEPLSKLGCCLQMYGIEDDTTDDCIITALAQDMPKIKQIFDQCSDKEQEKGDAIASRTRSKTAQAGSVQENVSDSGPALPPKSPTGTPPSRPPRPKKDSKSDNKPPRPPKPATEGNAEEKYLKVEDHLVNCLFKLKADELEALKKEFQVSIKISEDGIKLHGTSKTSLRKAVVRIEESIKLLKTKDLELNVPSNLVTEEDVQSVIQKVTNPVHIQVDGLDDREPEYFYSCWSSEKMPVCLIITHGKVENTKVDSIVVPCNADLSPSCEVAWNIFRKGKSYIYMKSLAFTL